MVEVHTNEMSDDLEQLYRERYAPLVRLARMIVGSQAVAEELVQDAFVRMHGAWTRIETPEAYARTTVVNLCRTWLERSGRERAWIATKGEAIALPAEYDETWKALQRLAPRYRSVLALRFYEDLAEAEIAAILGIRIGTVKSTIHRGLAALKKELGHG